VYGHPFTADLLIKLQQDIRKITGYHDLILLPAIIFGDGTFQDRQHFHPFFITLANLVHELLISKRCKRLISLFPIFNLTAAESKKKTWAERRRILYQKCLELVFSKFNDVPREGTTDLRLFHSANKMDRIRLERLQRHPS
jgi:hypothetical protein